MKDAKEAAKELLMGHWGGERGITLQTVNILFDPLAAFIERDRAEVRERERLGVKPSALIAYRARDEARASAVR